jgi:hypothetical protein
MTYKPCDFDRSEYLALSEMFEELKLDDVDLEKSEHNYDLEDIAYELAYSRYRIAKLEAGIEKLKSTWDAGWFCNGDENQIKFDLLMKKINLL